MTLELMLARTILSPSVYRITILDTVKILMNGKRFEYWYLMPFQGLCGSKPHIALGLVIIVLLSIK